MAKVLGVGGVYFRCCDPQETLAWYKVVLGIELNGSGSLDFPHRESVMEHGAGARTVVAPLRGDNRYFSPSSKAFMLNFIVDDLDAMIARIEKAGVPLAGEPVRYAQGRFAWVMDPNGLKIELWEPVEA